MWNAQTKPQLAGVRQRPVRSRESQLGPRLHLPHVGTVLIAMNAADVRDETGTAEGIDNGQSDGVRVKDAATDGQPSDEVLRTSAAVDDRDDRRSSNTAAQQSVVAPNADASEVVRSSSSTGQASLRSPSSPNPSFSSLQARPTPPATSGRSSPSPSLLSGGERSVPLHKAGSIKEEDESTVQAGMSASDSLTGALGAGEEGHGDSTRSPLDPLEALKTPQSLASGRLEAQSRQGKGIEVSQLFPEKLLRAGDGVSLGIETESANVAQIPSVDQDSDGYGQPSPREAPAVAVQATPFAAGYGEVPYGIERPISDQQTRSSEATTAEANANSAQKRSTMVDIPSKDGTIVSSFQVRVGDPQKVGDPVTAHIVYTVRIKTDSPKFKASQFSVLRRYSDFRWLHAALVHNNPGIFIPPVPEKVRTGRFAPDLVEARRHGLESCINKIANNPVLQLDDDFRLFLESQNFHADVKARDQIKGPVPTPEQKTYFGWSTSFTGATHRYHERDEWFEEQKVYLDHLEMHLKTLVRIISTLAQQRKEVAAATSETSHAFMMLSGSSLSRSLSTCFAGLGEVERRTFELDDLQADADVRDFGSVVYEFERMVGSARKAFATRIDAWQSWQRFEDEAKKVRVKHDKVKKDMQPGSYRAHDGGRLQAVLDELATIETKCLNGKREFDVIGRRCKEQMSLFEADRINAFHEACEVWLQGMIERNHEIMAEWEQYASLLERQTGQKISAD